MNIYFIRHGQKQDDSKNCATMELTKIGFEQANLLGKRLKIYNIERIYSSDMVRAIQTSETINKYLKVDLIVNHELREIDMGEYNDKGLKFIQDNYPNFFKEFSKHTSDLPYPKGECGEDVWKRTQIIVNEIINCGLKNVAVVLHGGIIGVLICGFLGIGQHKRFFLGEPLENCSISIIKYDNKANNYYLQSFNDHSHLEAVG
ncbi:histidine phosphatase family protein [Clostridium estertheticum]|uniref:Histidine phosphatase family protein n=1 Tax=Clostridium estertheticum TaxID=238834 RepID=A0AA47EM82_9CLOT|nr:histidine phosphatase family protein [Clostridium estertheticum]MBU3157350.1 histidine phosphatase family protein [Clostridium estertheticum]WAG62471.1 histidine phosphatase family protein [Clostridium estertheticum]